MATTLCCSSHQEINNKLPCFARQVNPLRVEEFMAAFEEATSRPNGYLMLDLKPTTDDMQLRKTNVLPREVGKSLKNQTYLQLPVLNAMHDAKNQMQDSMEGLEITGKIKSKLYSDQLNGFLNRSPHC